MVKPQDRDEKVLCFNNSEGLLCDVGQGEEGMDCRAALNGMDAPTSNRHQCAKVWGVFNNPLCFTSWVMTPAC
jgi:hypothetical protein